MEELTMLVQLAGGEVECVGRFKEAGYSTAADVAAGDLETLRLAGGLTAAVTKRLIQAARDRLSDAGKGEKRPSPVKEAVIRDVGEIASTEVLVSKPRKSQKGKAVPRSRSTARVAPTAGQQGTSQATVDQAASRPEAGPSGDTGVSREESVSVTREAPEESWTDSSFWRFG